MDRVRRRTTTLELERRGATREVVPVSLLRGAEQGATVVVTANVHGDEATGVAAVLQLAERLETLLVAGEVVLYPSVNPHGLRLQQRPVPADGVDLNRAFPGDRAGRGATGVAGRLWADLQRREPDLVLDLHADSVVAVPYTILDRPVRLDGERRQEMEEQLQVLAHAAGLLVLQEYPDDLYLRFGLDHSLAGAVVNEMGVPALTLEVGPRRAVDPASVDVTVGAVLRILAHLNMVREAPAARRRPQGRLQRTSAPRVRRPGVFVPVVRPGEAYGRGELLGVVRGLDGHARDEVRAEAPGVVVSWAEGAWIDVGAVPGTLGEQT
jgi:predicted deacylase